MALVLDNASKPQSVSNIGRLELPDVKVAVLHQHSSRRTGRLRRDIRPKQASAYGRLDLLNEPLFQIAAAAVERTDLSAQHDTLPWQCARYDLHPPASPQILDRRAGGRSEFKHSMGDMVRDLALIILRPASLRFWHHWSANGHSQLEPPLDNFSRSKSRSAATSLIENMRKRIERPPRTDAAPSEDTARAVGFVASIRPSGGTNATVDHQTKRPAIDREAFRVQVQS
jgi:hypothetical protein